MIEEYTMKNSQGMEVSYLNYGGIITSLKVRDKKGVLRDVAIGLDRIQGYQSNHPYFGAIVGRYANRIGFGRFSLLNKPYQLPINNGPHSLHGGDKGFTHRFWKKEQDELYYFSPNGEEGYPGNLKVWVTYSLSEENELIIKYRAKTDAPTPINLTNHTYFNLDPCSQTILNHKLMINADRYTVVDETLLPTGELRTVKDTPFDFTHKKQMGKDIHNIPGGGFDHNYVLNKVDGELSLAAIIESEESGIIMEVLTTEPGVQFYTGNFLDGTQKGKNRELIKHSAFCLETQHFPDSPNHEDFPSTILVPNKEFHSQTIYRFKV